ncbi:uncharacterized protein B0J16DRAFT_317985 [Fusarium flagelliforme]|uniref:uncharacterized protein n=1 Tax=Fusarium flagelliforme TaxID=2675880 RepID=UPI001E8EA9E0|nr:uncharacterized protein B0J16DRAFT_317985 [Fusarium flagelliforme]KAH7188315.1 hypothetical protein B0J16DRAFT_317985 [Fusarium flagelliforme]
MTAAPDDITRIKIEHDTTELDPHDDGTSIYKSHDVVQVNIPAESGEMGVLANHVPSIEQLKPGLVEVVEESAGSKQFFLSGGFATVQPNSVLSINAVEGYPLEDFSAEAIRNQIAEAQKVANGSGSEQDIAEAKIELEGQRATNGIKNHASRDSDRRRASSNLPVRNHQRPSVVRGPKGRVPSSRPSVTGFKPPIRQASIRQSQLPRYSAGTDLLPPDSLLTSYLASSDPSRTVSTTEKCQDALDILEQYGTIPGKVPGHRVPKFSAQYEGPHHTHSIPELPTDTHEEHALSERSQPTRATLSAARRRKTSRIVSEPQSPTTPRPTGLKSRLRPKDNQETLKTAPKKTIAVPTEISGSVKNNPFFMADKGTIKKPSEPAITARSVQVERKPKHSDCVPDRLLSESPRASHVQEECSDPSCRATHTGHHPPRHSIGCATRRSQGALVVEGNELDMIDEDKDKHEAKHAPSETKSPPRNKLQMKIDQLYHHEQDLHHSKHIMEHLAAGVKTLPTSTAEEKPPLEPDGRSRMGNYIMRVHSQPIFDHNLSRDETVTVGTESTKHSLSREPAVPSEIVSKPLNLNEHKGDQQPSPKSHEPHVNTQDNDAHWIRPSLGSHNQTYNVQEDHSRSLTSQPTGGKPILAPKTPNKELGTSRQVDGRIAPQAQNTPLPDKTDGANPSSDQLDEPVPGAHMLRKTIPRDESEKPNAEPPNISSWRTQLRKVDRSPEQPPSQRLTPSHVEDWRRELSSVNNRTPDKAKKEDCINCNPNQYISPQAENSFQDIAEVELQKKQHEKSAAVDSPVPRLKVTDIELSLARQGDKEEMIKQQEIPDKEAEASNNSDDPAREGSVMSTVIHDPTPMMPFNHMCAWRARYMDLKSQVDQLGDESSHTLPKKRAEGVGTLYTHNHTDVDIEGLTVVMHFKGQDDLVINTDLSEGLQEYRRQQERGDTRQHKS